MERLLFIGSFEGRWDHTVRIITLIRTGRYDISNLKIVGLSSLLTEVGG